MDPLGSITGAVAAPSSKVAEAQASPLPSAPLPPAARLADRPTAAAEPATPPLPARVQRESLTPPPPPPVMTREQMVALLNAALTGVRG